MVSHWNQVYLVFFSMIRFQPEDLLFLLEHCVQYENREESGRVSFCKSVVSRKGTRKAFEFQCDQIAAILKLAFNV